MATLSEFIGEIINDISKARSYGDYASASLSEQYYADPFVKNLPIPHYTIDEAEIEVPVMVMGINTANEHYQQAKGQLIDIVKQKLPLLIVQSYKFNFVQEREDRQQKENKEKAAEDSLNKETGGSRRAAREAVENFEFPAELLELFAESAKKITERMTSNLEKYLSQYNYEILKLLELSENFSKELMRAITRDNRGYKKEQSPYLSENTINRSSNYMGNIMFFEFKNIMHSDSGVIVDVITSKMSGYTPGSEKDCLMRIKIKIKEQDLNLVVEDRDGKEKRYLSLT